MIHLRVPEQCLIPVTPEEVPGANVHVWVFRAFLDGRLVRLMLPVLIPQTPGVDTANAQGGNDDVDGELAPKIARGRRVCLHGRTFTVKGIVCRTTQTLGGRGTPAGAQLAKSRDRTLEAAESEHGRSALHQHSTQTA